LDQPYEKCVDSSWKNFHNFIQQIYYSRNLWSKPYSEVSVQSDICVWNSECVQLLANLCYSWQLIIVWQHCPSFKLSLYLALVKQQVFSLLSCLCTISLQFFTSIDVWVSKHLSTYDSLAPLMAQLVLVA
jgi:hypothetical protein